jgi:outer membrane protein assembly factor BamA
LKDIGFVGEAAFSAAELRAAFTIADAEIFDPQKIAYGLENLRDLYGTKGYVFFSAVPNTEIDEKGKTISLTLDVDEGHVFRFGKAGSPG